MSVIDYLKKWGMASEVCISIIVTRLECFVGFCVDRAIWEWARSGILLIGYAPPQRIWITPSQFVRVSARAAVAGFDGLGVQLFSGSWTSLVFNMKGLFRMREIQRDFDRTEHDDFVLNVQPFMELCDGAELRGAVWVILPLYE